MRYRTLFNGLILLVLMVSTSVLFSSCGGTTTSGVKDKLMFWKEKEPVRITPQRYDDAGRLITPPTQQVETPEPEPAATSDTTVKSETSSETGEEGVDIYEDLSPSERRQLKKIEKEAKNIRQQHRLKQKVLSPF